MQKLTPGAYGGIICTQYQPQHILINMRPNATSNIFKQGRINMDSPDQIQDSIDELLCFMNDQIEHRGALAKDITFGFLPEQEDDYQAFMTTHDWPREYFEKIIKICVSRKLIEYAYFNNCHDDPLGAVNLTEEGQSRAISVKHGKDRSYELGPAMQIAGITINGGVAQIGHGNTQNIQNILTQLIEQIEASDAPEEQKQEAKSRLTKFLEHPLVCSIVGGLVSAGITAGTNLK